MTIRRENSKANGVATILLVAWGATAVEAFRSIGVDYQTRRQGAYSLSVRHMTPNPASRDLFADEESALGFLDSTFDAAAAPLSFYDIDDEDESEQSSFADFDARLELNEDEDSRSMFDGFEREESEILDERESRLYEHSKTIERCVLVGVEDVTAKRRSRYMQQALDESKSGYSNAENILEKELYFTLDESLSEMRELIKTAGMEVAGEVTQRLNDINPKFYVNTGKVEEAKEMLLKMNCKTIVFDAELSPGQQKSLENAFNKKLIQNDFLVSEQEIKVIDRTALILDIFAQHAKTKEGKLQVDLALHEYRKPRLTKMWTHLERQSGAGGVGLRGPGELQLEIDKRLIRDRINTLKTKINEIGKQRTMRRRGRERLGLPLLSLVGYTNSGKSTLLNYLTRAGVMAESMLFATLDPTTRKVKLPGYKTHPEVLLTDTVGFIQKLPTHLVAAFRATLEEVKDSDILVHVIDVSNPSWEKQEASVRSVLADMGCGNKPIVRVLNKIDLLDRNKAEYLRLGASQIEHTVAVSALSGDGLADLVACVEDALAELLVSIEVLIPYAKGDELNTLHEQGNVDLVEYQEAGTYVRALVPQAIANRLEQYSLLESARIEETQDDHETDWVGIGRGRHTATVD
ncbi:hypothetical protein MPSEU_000708700 [Mayamaea pseudoterrestris]|nr:hypothetical protein MPSEU_000708700 [Mayamaea pseudoterrestris]